MDENVVIFSKPMSCNFVILSDGTVAFRFDAATWLYYETGCWERYETPDELEKFYQQYLVDAEVTN